MAQIAKVAALTGKAYVVGVDGLLRALKVGDVIEKGEVIRTDVGAHVELMMADGQTVALAPEVNVRVDESMVQADSRPATQDSAVQSATVDAVIQALDRGGDLNQELEAAAAGADGGGLGGGDSTFVRLLRIAEPTNPLAYNYSLGDLPVIQTVQTAVVPAVTPVTGTVTFNLIYLDESGKPLVGPNGGYVLVDSKNVVEGSHVGVIATVDQQPTVSNLVITLDNGHTITIPVGQNSGYTPVDIRADDLYVQGTENITVKFVSASGGGYDQLDVQASTSVGVVDDQDPTTISITRVDAEGHLISTDVVEGEKIVFRFSVDHAPVGDLKVNFTIGTEVHSVTIKSGETYADVSVDSRPDDLLIQGNTSVTPVITGVDPVSNGNYEAWKSGSTVTATIVDDHDPVYLQAYVQVADNADGSVRWNDHSWAKAGTIAEDPTAANHSGTYVVLVTDSSGVPLATQPTGDLTGSVTVTYAAGTPAATAGVDYTTPVSTTVAVGTTFTVSATDDNLVEKMNNSRSALGGSRRRPSTRR